MKPGFKKRLDKRGLYANIAAKRRRIKAQKERGAEKVERMRKPGSEGAPSADDFKKSAKTAKGAKRQDPGRMMYDKDGCKMCKGSKKPCRCGKADKSPYADGYGKKCDAVANDIRDLLIKTENE